MKTFKVILLIFFILTVFIVLFRGFIFRNFVEYISVGQRDNYSATDKKLILYIESNITNLQNPDINKIINKSLSLTSKKLNFKIANNYNDPNKLILTKNAHCIGYAAFFSTICNYLLKKYNLNNQWIAKPQKGQIYFLGKNVHKYFNSGFSKTTILL